MTTTSISFGTDAVARASDPDEQLCIRMRDLALVDLDSLVAGARDGQLLLGAFADDVADALRDARMRITALRGSLGGADPLNVLELAPRQRASDTATASIERIRHRLTHHADAARSLARLSELAAPLVAKLFEADRRR